MAGWDYVSKMFFDTTPDPCPSCDGLRAGTYDPGEIRNKTQKLENAIADAPPGAKRAELYTDLAEQWLKSAAHKVDAKTDTASVKMLIEGTNEGRALVDRNGRIRAYDGAFDALNAATNNGGDPARIAKLNKSAHEMDTWAKQRLHEK